MKLTPVYSVAFYSATQCRLCDSQQLPKGDDLLPSYSGPTPDTAQIEALQESLLAELNDKIIKNVVVVVPDQWLSITEHELDHIIPAKLAPLVALTYATEYTFSSPEHLCFNYRQKVLQDQHTQLMVFACTGDLVAALCLPFKQRGSRCLFMSQKQWAEAQQKKRPWHWLTCQSLVAYEPEKEKRQESRRLIACLVSISLLINLVAYLCFDSWNKESGMAELERQHMLSQQSSWTLNSSLYGMSEMVLKLMQGLPMSVRLNSFEGNDQEALVLLTLSASEIASLLEVWRKEQPKWHWEIEQLTSKKSSLGGQEGGSDVAISISKI